MPKSIDGVKRIKKTQVDESATGDKKDPTAPLKSSAEGRYSGAGEIKKKESLAKSLAQPQKVRDGFGLDGVGRAKDKIVRLSGIKQAVPIIKEISEKVGEISKSERDGFNLKKILSKVSAKQKPAPLQSSTEGRGKEEKREKKKMEKIEERKKREEEHKQKKLAEAEKKKQQEEERKKRIQEVKEWEEKEKRKELEKKREKEKTKREKLEMNLEKKRERKRIKEEKKAGKLKKRKEQKEKVRQYVKKAKGSAKKMAIGLIILVVLCLLIIGGLSFFVYKTGEQSNFTKLIIYKLPFPAAIVNYGNFIRYSDYLDDLRLLKDYYIGVENIKEEPAQSAESGDEMDKEFENVIFAKNVKKAILQKLARKYEVVVDEDELDNALDALSKNFINDIYNKYGLTKEIYQQRILYDKILESKIAKLAEADEEINKSAILKIEKLKKLIKKGEETFEELAQRYSEAPSSFKGGDVGYVNIKEMSPEMKEAVIGLEAEQVSEVIREEGEYYVVKVYDKKINKLGEEIWLKQILIKTNFDFEDYLEELRSEAKIWRLIQL